MNLATPFQFDSISLPAWTATAIRHTRRATAYSSIVIKAFSKTLAPVIAVTVKDLSHYCFECVQFAGLRVMTAAGIQHNPVRAAFLAAHAELVSTESLTTYRRIRHITRETAMDALVVGLCGVVAVSVGVEVVQKGYRLAQQGYGAARKLYAKVYARLNPSEPAPELLPSCEMAIASTELAAALDKFATVAEADVKAKATEDAEVQYCLESMQREQAEASFAMGQIWNPATRDMHLEVARLMALQPVPFALSPAPELVAQVQDQKLQQQAEQKPARAPRSTTKATPQDKSRGQRKSTKMKEAVK